MTGELVFFYIYNLQFTIYNLQSTKLCLRIPAGDSPPCFSTSHFGIRPPNFLKSVFGVFYDCILCKMCYNTRVLYVMAILQNNNTGRKLVVATAEVQRRKPEGLLYYLLPPLLVLAVIIYCHVADSPAAPPTKEADTAGAVAE